MDSDLVHRLRWGNVARAAALLAAVAAVVLWPSLAPPEPALPADLPQPVATAPEHVAGAMPHPRERIGNAEPVPARPRPRRARRETAPARDRPQVRQPAPPAPAVRAPAPPAPAAPAGPPEMAAPVIPAPRPPLPEFGVEPAG